MEKALEKAFFDLDEVQPVGLPAARTLRNRLDARSGEIRLGGDVPPLQTLRLGGARVIAKTALVEWLQLVSGARDQAVAPATAPVQEPPAPAARRSRGRPRKSFVQGERP